MTVVIKEKDMDNLKGSFVIAIALILATGAAILESSVTYHIVEVIVNGNPFYEIQSCRRFTGCDLTGQRYSHDDKGLSEATDEYNEDITRYKGPQITKVIK